jgi:proteic killer suppression protein
MEYFGETAKLTKLLNDPRALQRQYGALRANKIRIRLTEFTAAKSLSDISHLPPARLHRLFGDRDQQFAVDIVKNWRITFSGFDQNDDLTTDKGKIVALLIHDIEDYH